MTSYEQLGLFYLGRRFDPSSRARSGEPVLYDSKDLLTHAVIAGMTGSGKTGLGIGLIEEAAIDGIPVLAIDPKGDLANLLLTFPNLSPAEFAPWVTGTPDTPRDVLAEQQADRWSRGLAEWDQSPERIARLRSAADVHVYTPGSRAGTPLALLKGFEAASLDDPEDAAAHAGSTASSLLALAGIADAGPHTREQTLLATILAAAGPGADLPWLVQQIQRPAVSRIGVIDLDTFYPPRDRQELALRFNSILAAPGFDVWLAGEPLDIGRLLYAPDGRPRVSIVSIAHLGDAERMLVVSRLLDAVLEWTRRQPGTASLRALVYMDEVFGYLPPVSNPPSKRPLLTLLKQARAFGVGLTLATQNPVDLDYKALSNAGTWFLGKLQTERDKARVLEGIEGISASVDRQTLDKLLSSLASRVFLMHNVHEPEPIVFETRWTLSYLRGPMTRDEIKRAAAQRASAEAPHTKTTRQAVPGNDTKARVDGPSWSERPVLPSGIRDLFLPSVAPPTSDHGVSGAMDGKPVAPPTSDHCVSGAMDGKPGAPPTSDHRVSGAMDGKPVDGGPGGDGDGASYVPVLYGSARIHYEDAKRGIDHTSDVHVVTPFGLGAIAVDWEHAAPIDAPPEALKSDPAPERPGRFGDLPPPALDPKAYAGWTKDFEHWVARTQTLTLHAAASLKLSSRPGEHERDFRIRLQQAAHEARDAAVEKLRARHAPRLRQLVDRLRRAEEAVGREAQQARQQQTQSAVSIGATLLGALMGRKAVSMSTLGRATTAARGVSRSMKESQDVARAQERVEDVQAELNALEAKVEEEVATLVAGTTVDSIPIETIAIKPKRGGVSVRLVSLAWRART